MKNLGVVSADTDLDIMRTRKYDPMGWGVATPFPPIHVAQQTAQSQVSTRSYAARLMNGCRAMNRARLEITANGGDGTIDLGYWANAGSGMSQRPADASIIKKGATATPATGVTDITLPSAVDVPANAWVCSGWTAGGGTAPTFRTVGSTTTGTSMGASGGYTTMISLASGSLVENITASGATMTAGYQRHAWIIGWAA